MSEITAPAIKIFKHRSFMDWHGPLVAKNAILGCMNLNCPVGEHLMDESWHDPHSWHDIVAIPLGTRVLILTDYCDKEHVAYLTLREIYDLGGCTQLRFSEGSRRCWYFQPNGRNGHSVYLDSVRYVAVVKSNATAFGKFGGIACFKRELSRLSGLELPAINRLIRQLEKAIPAKPFGLKPWSMSAQILEEKFLNNDRAGFSKIMHAICCNKSPANELVAFLMPYIQQGKLEEVMALTKGEKFICPDNFAVSFEKVKKHLTRSFPEIVKPASTWEEQWRQFFGV